MTEEVESVVEPELFTIPAANLERLNKEVAKLNRRADKLGFPHMGINIVERREIRDPRYQALVDSGQKTWDRVPFVTVIDVTLDGEALKIEGYELMGTLDHYSIPGKVIVRTVPGQTIPTEFHNRDATCDHCKKIRRRIETFVLRETGTDNHLAIGRQCVRDFIGYNVAALARYLERWKSLFGDMNDHDGEYWTGGRIVRQYNKESVLATTFGMIRVKGWRPKSKCDFEAGEVPTSAHVISFFSPPKWVSGMERERREYEELCSEVASSYKDDLKEAADAVVWLSEQDDTNEYMHNLHVLNECESIPMNMFGYWCSLAAAFQRAQERLRYQESQRKKQTNEWVGDVKERLNFTVEVITIRAFDNHYGVVNQHRMLDDKGRTLIWWANTNSGMKAGKTYKIKGTVKKHDEYKDWKQTVLNRVAVIEEVEIKEAA